MKVLHLTNSLFFEDEGLYSQSLSLGLHRMGHDLTLLAPPGPLMDELIAEGVDVRTFPFLARPALEVFRSKTIYSSVKEEEWDLIHGHNLRQHGLVSALSRRLDVPWTVTLQAFVDETDDVNPDSTLLSGVIATGEELREHGVNDIGISKQLMEVIQPGVDLTKLQKKPVFRDGLVPIVALGTPLVKEKRVDLFLDVVETVTEGHRSVTFFVLKHGPYEDTMRKMMRERNLEQHVMIQSNPDVYFDILPEIDVLLSTDPRLELGLVILHVMGCGKPVISSGTGGAFHAVDDRETGFLVSLKDGGREMTDRLEFLLQHPEEAREMGTRARARVTETFALERMLDETSSFFSRAIAD